MFDRTPEPKPIIRAGTRAEGCPSGDGSLLGGRSGGGCSGLSAVRGSWPALALPSHVRGLGEGA